MLPEWVTNKGLRNKLTEIARQVELLEDQVRDNQIDADQHEMHAFLLAEFANLQTFWDRTSSRMDSTANQYLTGTALIFTGIAFLSQQFTDTRSFVALVTFAATIIFVAGLIVVRRIIVTVFLTTQYLNGLNLIRRYFVDQYPSLSPFLVLPVAASPAEIHPEDKEAPGSKVPFVVRSLILPWCSFLCGFIAASIAWLIELKLRNWAFVGFGAAVGVVSLLLLQFWARGQVKN